MAHRFTRTSGYKHEGTQTNMNMHKNMNDTTELKEFEDDDGDNGGEKTNRSVRVLTGGVKG